MMYRGLTVRSSELCTEPKIQLSRHVMVTDEFRAKQNAWLEQMFGRKPTAYLIAGRVLYAHPDIIDELIRASLQEVVDWDAYNALMNASPCGPLSPPPPGSEVLVRKIDSLPHDEDHGNGGLVSWPSYKFFPDPE